MYVQIFSLSQHTEHLYKHLILEDKTECWQTEPDALVRDAGMCRITALEANSECLETGGSSPTVITGSEFSALP